MEPAEAWKELLRDRVAGAAWLCGTVAVRLIEVRALIEAPIHMAGAEAAAAARANLDAALESLEMSAYDLDIAAAYVLAAKFIGNRGCRINPAEPPASVIQRASNAAARTALTRLELAYPNAANACETIEWCRGRLSTARAMLDHPGLPDLDGLVDYERARAHYDLGDALVQVRIGFLMTNYARMDLSDPGDD